MSSAKSCAVCGGPNHGVRFGVPSCRACASFFKRTILERKTYSCRKENDCVINEAGMRNSCRSCRLERCQRAGMKAESSHMRVTLPVPLAPGSSQPHATLEAAQASVPITAEGDSTRPEGNWTIIQSQVLSALSSADVSSQWPHLEQYLTGFRAFMAAQKSLYDAEHPELVFSEPKLVRIQMDECKRMDKQSIALIYNMICEYFTPLARFSPTDKKALLRTFSYDFLCIWRCYMNATGLPKDSPHFLSFHGRYLDGTDMAHAFDNRETATDEQISYVGQCFTRVRVVIDKFRELSVTELECAALAAVMLFTTMENLLLDGQKMRENRDVVLAELLQYLNATHGTAVGGVRFGRLLLFLREMSVFVAWMEETMTFVKIFMDHDLYGFWNEEEHAVSATQ